MLITHSPLKAPRWGLIEMGMLIPHGAQRRPHEFQGEAKQEELRAWMLDTCMEAWSHLWMREASGPGSGHLSLKVKQKQK